MTAQIVWRNPMPPANSGNSISRVNSSEAGVVYSVGTSDAKYELIRKGFVSPTDVLASPRVSV